MAINRHLTREDKEHLVKLRLEGLSLLQIQKITGVSLSSISIHTNASRLAMIAPPEHPLQKRRESRSGRHSERVEASYV